MKRKKVEKRGGGWKREKQAKVGWDGMEPNEGAGSGGTTILDDFEAVGMADQRGGSENGGDETREPGARTGKAGWVSVWVCGRLGVWATERVGRRISETVGGLAGSGRCQQKQSRGSIKVARDRYHHLVPKIARPHSCPAWRGNRPTGRVFWAGHSTKVLGSVIKPGFHAH